MKLSLVCFPAGHPTISTSFSLEIKRKKKEKSRHLKLQGKTTKYRAVHLQYLLLIESPYIILCSSLFFKAYQKGGLYCVVALITKKVKIDFLIFLERPAKPNSGTNMFGGLLEKADDIWRSDSISHSYLSLTMKHLRRLQSLALKSDRTLDYLIQNLCSIHLQIVSPHYL